MATAAAAIKAARERLKSAYFGLEDMEKRPERFQSGLMNAVVFARMVTFSLQNMQNDVPEWSAWYAEKQIQMAKDPEMQFFKQLRNEIEKTANQPVAVSGYIQNFSSSDLALFKPAPPGATSFVMGHAAYGGASGWLIKRDDGSEEIYAVQLPESMIKTTLSFLSAPDVLQGKDVRILVRDHLQKLTTLIDEVKAKFL